jgi:enediyne biosynthesis protein E5
MSPKPPEVSAPPPPPSVEAPPKKDPIPASRVSALGLTIRAVLSCIILIACFASFGDKTLFEIIRDSIPSVPPAVLALITTTLVAAAFVLLWRRVITIGPQFQAPLLITYILAVGHAAYGIEENHTSLLLDRLTKGWITTYSPTFVAIISSILTEIVLSRLIAGKWPHLASAYIGGISVGILIKGPELWPYVLCTVLSIASKYAIRVKGRHLWNPSNFGVTLMLILASNTVAALSVQSGNEIWPVLVIAVLGCLILFRLGLLHIPICFVTTFIGLSYLRSLYTGNPFLTEVGVMTSPMFLLFTFFMITDPKTITRKFWSQCTVAVLVAVMECVLRLERDVHSLFHSLFIVGPITNLIEIWWQSRKKR